MRRQSACHPFRVSEHFLCASVAIYAEGYAGGRRCMQVYRGTRQTLRAHFASDEFRLSQVVRRHKELILLYLCQITDKIDKGRSVDHVIVLQWIVQEQCSPI